MKRFNAIFFFLIGVILPLSIILYSLYRAINEKTGFSIGILPTPYEKPLPWLKTDGAFIVDGSGQKVILKGVNIASIDWGYSSWHPKAISFLAKNWKINVIRVRLIQSDFENDPNFFFSRIEKEFLKPARQNGLYVIFHPRVNNTGTDLPDEGTLAMWKAIAEKYKNDSHVLYDLIAEPHNASRQSVVDAYNQLIPAVREINPNSLIFATGLDWGREINPYASDPLPYSNIVYRSSPYDHPNEFAGDFEQIVGQYPVFFGEFGPKEKEPALDLTDVKALLDYAKAHDIGWAAWNFHSIGCPCLLSDWKNFQPSDYGKLALNYL